MIFRRVSKGRFVFLGNGSTTYHPLYIDNLVDAFIRAAEVDEANGRSYLIANAEYVAIRDLVERTAAALGQPCRRFFLPFWPAYALAAAVELAYKPLLAESPIFRRRLDWFRQNRAFRIDRAEAELGWQLLIGRDEGCREPARGTAEKGLI
jgi:nucleoside-diphosphate-sugar epimerase